MQYICKPLISFSVDSGAQGRKCARRCMQKSVHPTCLIRGLFWKISYSRPGDNPKRILWKSLAKMPSFGKACKKSLEPYRPTRPIRLGPIAKTTSSTLRRCRPCRARPGDHREQQEQRGPGDRRPLVAERPHRERQQQRERQHGRLAAPRSGRTRGQRRPSKGEVRTLVRDGADLSSD